MKIKRSKIAEIIEQEVRRALFEADDEKKKKPEVVSADTDPNKPKDQSSTNIKPDNADQADLPDDESDEKEKDALDASGESGEEPSGAVNNEVSGKTLQAVTIEPKSKILPGSKEVVFAFNESTDALRILVTSTGQVKFFWRGQLHDMP